MRTLTLLRLILRTLRELRAERQAIASELRTLNATLNQLLLVNAKAANYFPAQPTRGEAAPQWALGKDDAQVFAESEATRLRLATTLGREPLDEELWRELESTIERAGSRV